MSSHHFVRDEQEPAILILDTVSFELIGPLLEWVPTVTVDVAQLPLALSWGIKIDIVLLDEVPTDELITQLMHQAPYQLIVKQTDKTALETGLEILKSTHHHAVNVILPEFVPKLIPLESLHTINIVCFAAGWRYYYSRSNTLKKWFLAQTELQFFDQVSIKDPHGVNVEKISQDGLHELCAQSPFWIGERLH